MCHLFYNFPHVIFFCQKHVVCGSSKLVPGNIIPAPTLLGRDGESGWDP